jgi:hypothetical protein
LFERGRKRRGAGAPQGEVETGKLSENKTKKLYLFCAKDYNILV